MNATAIKSKPFNLKLSTAIYKETLSKILQKEGWAESSMGHYRSSGQIKEKKGFKLYIRTRNLNSFIDDFSKKTSLGRLTKPHKI